MISLTFLHLLVSFIDDTNKKKIDVVVEPEPKVEVKKNTEIVKEVEVIDNPVVFEDVVEEEKEKVEQPTIIDPDDIGDGPPVEDEFSEPEILDEIDEVLVDEPVPYVDNEVEKELDVFEDIEDVIKEEAKKLEDEVKDPTILLKRDVRLKQNRINKLKNKVLERVQQRKDELLKQTKPKKEDVVLEEPEPKKVTKLVYRNKRKNIDNDGEDRGFSVNIPKQPRKL